MSELRSMQVIHAPSPSAPAMFGVGEPTRVAHSPQKILVGFVREYVSYFRGLRHHFFHVAIDSVRPPNPVCGS